MRSIKVATVHRQGGPFVIESATMEPPRADEVLVRMVATGMCHTDIVVRDRPFSDSRPIVLGHEGAGVVESVGSRVDKVKPGDHVVLSFLSCGGCQSCHAGTPSACQHIGALNFGGARPDGSHALCDVHGVALNDRFFGQSSFATYAIANQRNVVRVRKDAPLELLGPLGCGLLTGAGTVLNALKVHAGSSFAVFGAGAVGLSAVMAARVAGATTIIAIDIVPSRLELALQLGATHAVNSKDGDPVTAIRAIVGEGVGYGLDTTGMPLVIKHMVAALRVRGVAAIVGASEPGAQFALDIGDLMVSQKTIRGVLEGDSVPDILIPDLVDLHMQGRFPIQRLVEFFTLDTINDAAASSARGGAVKPIIRIGDVNP